MGLMFIAFRKFTLTERCLHIYCFQKLIVVLIFLQVEATIEHICRHEGGGAILVFLTGWDDISKLLEKLKANIILGDPNKFLILPLHGSMPTINQREIFDRPHPNVRYAFVLLIFSIHI